MASLRLCAGAAEPPKAEEIEFFEKRVRPVLVESCYRCHSTQAEKVKGGLWLDSRAAVLKGGEDGPVVVLGHPEKSRMIEALEYRNPDLQMPPKRKLSDTQIADFVAWIKMGLPWPEEQGKSATFVRTSNFDLSKRRREHWAWSSIHSETPPDVRDRRWPRNPVDQFILASLEQHHLHPAPLTNKRTLLRRLSFDLVGLPPTLEEQNAFLNDQADDAYERLVDRLLDSPHFGERWARHWLDLVRYAETLGHEFDYANPNAWRYRDYVIRAFNSDLPYTQFVLEHVAGDLLPAPRRNPSDGNIESAIGPVFYWLGQRDHSPVDVRQHQAEVIDNQIDVLTKTFLGLTVACARCHDHKFDAISTADYYGLYGILSSSRYDLRAIDPPEAVSSKVQQLTRLKPLLRTAVATTWLSQATASARHLQAAAELSSRREANLPGNADALDEVSAEFNVARERLDRWAAALEQSRASAGASSGGFQTARAAVPSGAVVFADFTAPGAELKGWFVEGEAFSASPVPRGEFICGGPHKPVARILEESAMDSAVLSRRLQGVLRSPTFTITNRYIQILAAGRDARINVPVDNFTMIRDPIYGGLKRVLNHDSYQWITIDVEMWKGHRAYLEFSDVSAPDPADDAHRNGFNPNGYLSVQRVLFSENPEPPRLKAPVGLSSSAAEFKDPDFPIQCERTIVGAIRAWACGQISPSQGALLNFLLDHELLDSAAASAAVQLAREYGQVEASIPDRVRVPCLTDGTGLDERVFIRGNHKLEGPRASRRFLEAIAGTNEPPIASGSGRLELARELLAPSNPLLARVMVNRVWLHLFGRGIVATPDDFGALGQPPSNPALLDWLADWYRTDGGWSTKKLIRHLVTSRAYQMSSRPDDDMAEEKDPANVLWHRMPIRRLEGEAIRDNILAVSGALNPSMFGPPVPVHLTEFMEGRGRPGMSGPLDGAGRRSIYVEVRRNFVSPMMRAFDMPVPFSTIGRRNVSNVPAQSLILMNDPFVTEQAHRWAKAVLSFEAKEAADRIARIYEASFCRRPSRTELGEAVDFLKQQGAAYGLSDSEWVGNEQVWADLCHVIFNVKEFVFVN